MNFSSDFSLKKKVAFITGGAGLIGAEILKAISHSGALAINLDIDKTKGNKLKKELNNSGFMTDFRYFNVTNLNDLKKNIKALIKEYKKVDIWINCAYPRTKDWLRPLNKVLLNSWIRNIDMHLNSYCWTSLVVASLMKKLSIPGSIINFASIYGVLAPDFSLYEDTDITTPAAYAAIKGGIIAFSRYLASYYGGDNIRINCISPGGILNHQSKLFLKRYCQKVPLKRMANKEEITGAVLYLASDASKYVTGQNIIVDGGYSIS